MASYCVFCRIVGGEVPAEVVTVEAALRASARATADHLAGPGHWVSCLPVHHVAGFQVLVRSVVAGTDPVVLDTSAGFRAANLAAAVDRLRPDLPDDALDLIGSGVLSEGHGRALLLADGHDVRRGLAERAAAEGWSVRVLEARAREAHGGSRSKAPRVEVSADHSAAAETIGDRWSRLRRGVGPEGA